ncbi:MAG: branched-chain amino acid ABC transporter permease [Candidatus Izemoplasmatales bacterium]|nr:branched-chain amino acid ABC transporter permease [Candidatus Izemoplasmatales bacterium]
MRKKVNSPNELADSPSKLKKLLFRLDRTVPIIFFVLLTFVVLNTLIDTGILTRYYATILVMITVSVIMATSLNIATGFLGQLVLGHAGFMALGAYSAALTAIALNDVIPNNFLLFLVSAIVAMLVAALAGLIVGTPALRLRGDYLGIMTLGFGEIVKVVLTNLDITNGAQGLTSIPRIMSFPLAYFTMVFIVGFIALFMNSRHGRAMLSIREDEIASESVGINITKYKIIGFVMASMFGGVGGAIYAFQIGFLAPTAFNFVKSIDIFVIVVLGGMGSLTGSIVAAIVLTFLPEALRDFAKYRLLIYSTLLILTMLFRPQGLMGTKEISMSYSSIKMKVVNFPKTIKLKFKQWFKRGDI